MRCVCGGRLRVRQTREPGTVVAGRAGRLVEELLDRIGMGEVTYTVRDRVCDACGAVVGTAEVQMADLQRVLG